MHLELNWSRLGCQSTWLFINKRTDFRFYLYPKSKEKENWMEQMTLFVCFNIVRHFGNTSLQLFDKCVQCSRYEYVLIYNGFDLFNRPYVWVWKSIFDSEIFRYWLLLLLSFGRPLLSLSSIDTGWWPSI